MMNRISKSFMDFKNIRMGIAYRREFIKPHPNLVKNGGDGRASIESRIVKAAEEILPW